MEALKKAYYNTGAKIILNFGKNIVPMVNAWSQLMKHVQVNDDCDQNCAVKCLDVKASLNNMFFDKSCLASCNCHFAMDKLGADKIQEKWAAISDENKKVKDLLWDLKDQAKTQIKP